MAYISFVFYIFLAISLLFYYISPLKKRWIILLISNVIFYIIFFKAGRRVFLLTILMSYVEARLLPLLKGKLKKSVFIIGVISLVIPWFILKEGTFIAENLMRCEGMSFSVPIGISFYTLQLTAYLADVFSGKIAPQRNIIKYVLFVSFFPQIFQGPIPRYDQLQDQLIEGHPLDENEFIKGCYLIIWGFFLKLVIADKAAVVANQVFDNYGAYDGLLIWIASILYSIQLYTDFLACTTLAQGISRLYGIRLAENFRRPYFAASIQDFWRRWHISLSSWLRDYIYIPLGGSRKGKLCKYSNLIITFIISGFWHGAGIQYIMWGLIHAVYQIIGGLFQKPGKWFCRTLHISDDSKLKRCLCRGVTFLGVNFAWIIFRADTWEAGVLMIKNMLTRFNPWILFDNSLFMLGLSWKEFMVLVLAVYILWKVEAKQEQGICITDKILRQRLPIRWAVCLAAILGIVTFGTYGFGFNAQDFIYGGF